MADEGDRKETLAVIQHAAAGGKMGGKWKWGEAAKPILIGATAGGLTLVLSEYFLRDQFQTDGVDDEGAWWKRALSKFAIGAVGFLVLRKMSLPAALGVGIAGFVGAAHDLLVAPEGPFRLNERLDQWSSDSGSGSNTGADSGSGSNTGSGTSTGGGAGAPMRARNVLPRY